MLADLRNHEPDTELSCDLCIVGAGAAGITLARTLDGCGADILLLEAGGQDYDKSVQEAFAGEVVGHPYYALADARLRFFGGTTNIWGGRCAPLDAVDFSPRPWVPHSGWPFGPEALEPYYRHAHQLLELGEPVYDDSLFTRLGLERPPLDPEDIDLRFFRFDTCEERFNASRCQDLFASRHVTVLLHAAVTHLEADDNARAVHALRLATPEGAPARVRARHVVLAAGGLENPRLLLASDDVEPAGIGNRHDQVGRYFMEHPHGRLGQLHVPDPWTLYQRLGRRHQLPTAEGAVPVAPLLRPADAAQARHGILNTAVTLKIQRDPALGPSLNRRLYQSLKHSLDPTRSGRGLWHLYKRIRTRLQASLDDRRAGALTRFGRRGLYAIVRAEQAPDPASRVRRAATRDALGVPRVELDWRLGAQDKATLVTLARLLDGTLRRSGLGRFEPAAWLDEPGTAWPVDPTVSNHPIGGYHHMGTTRMSDSPRHGVVDAQGRVHGYGNLWIAGSSVFPTGGWANPTLTLLALTLRLAETLRPRLSAAQAPATSTRADVQPPAPTRAG